MILDYHAYPIYRTLELDKHIVHYNYTLLHAQCRYKKLSLFHASDN